MEKWMAFEDEGLTRLAEHHLHNFTLVALMLNMRPATVGRKRSPRQCQERYQQILRERQMVAQTAAQAAQAAAANAAANVGDPLAAAQAARAEAAARAAKAGARASGAGGPLSFGALRVAREGLLHAPWPSHRQEEGITPSVLPVTQVRDADYNARRQDFLELIKSERKGKPVVPAIPGTEGGALEGVHSSHDTTLAQRGIPAQKLLTPLQIMNAILQKQKQLQAAASGGGGGGQQVAASSSSSGSAAVSAADASFSSAVGGAVGAAAAAEVASATTVAAGEVAQLPVAGQQSLPPQLSTVPQLITLSNGADVPAMSPFSQVAASAAMQQAKAEREQAMSMSATALSPSATAVSSLPAVSSSSSSAAAVAGAGEVLNGEDAAQLKRAAEAQAAAIARVRAAQAAQMVAQANRMEAAAAAAAAKAAKQASTGVAGGATGAASSSSSSDAAAKSAAMVAAFKQGAKVTLQQAQSIAEALIAGYRTSGGTQLSSAEFLAIVKDDATRKKVFQAIQVRMNR